MTYDRLIYKIRNYAKYQDEFAILINDSSAYYFGKREPLDKIMVVSRGQMTQGFIVRRLPGSRVEWAEASLLDQDANPC